jgi:aryl-alcohol dehydrogenase-like predicted oxidoreductase
VLCWSPLASGFLADGFDLENLDPDDFRRARPYAQEPTFSRLKELRQILQKIAQDNKKTMAQLAIAWVLRQSAVTGAINGIRSPQEAMAMPGCLDWKLTDQELQAIEDSLDLFSE